MMWSLSWLAKLGQEPIRDTSSMLRRLLGVGALRCAVTVLACAGFFVASSRYALAQQELRDSAGNCLGWHYSLQYGAPRIIILPHQQGDEDVRNGIARKLLHLRCNIYIPELPALFYNPHTSPETLLKLLHRVVTDITRNDDPSSVVLMGAARSGSLAMMAATNDFRVKQVIALSPGEYFDAPDMVKRTVDKLRVPLLILYAPHEGTPIRTLCQQIPKELVIFSPTLHETGYQTLLQDQPESGPAWLAISIFYSEQFGK